MTAKALRAGLWSFYGQPTPFVGRVKPLHRMRESVRNAIEHNTRYAVIIQGPAGIGKSRLMHEFTETLGEHVDRVRVVAIACRPDASPPYRALLRLLRRRFDVPGGLTAEQVRDAIARGVVEVVGPGAGADAHFICQLVGLPFPDSRHIAAVDGDPARVAEHAVAAFARMLTADARKQPLVIAIDNLHLARDETLTVLEAVAVRVQGPLLFVAAARPSEHEALRRFIRHVQTVGESVTLTDLSDREGRKVLSGLLKRCDKVPEGFIRRTLEKAFGNPLSIEQIVQLQVERGAIEIRGDRWLVHADRLDDTRIPGTLRDVVRSKLERIDALERSVLEKASVVGEVFWLGCLDVLRRADEGRHWEDTHRLWTTTERSDELVRVVDSLRRRHILSRLPQSSIEGTRAYSFKHSIEREVIYDGIAGPKRARLHRVVAQWLESHGGVDSEAPVELIARHWERGHHPAKASGYYIEAGRRAFAQHMNAEAVGHFRKALACLSDDDAVHRIQVFHDLGRVHLVLGDASEALGCFQQMLDLAWTLDDENMGGLAYNNMGKAYRMLGEYELALDQLKHATVLFRRVEDVRGIAASADEMGRVHRLRGDLDRAEERIREGLRLREFLKDERSLAVSMHHLGNVYTERGAFREAAQTLQKALGLARAARDQRTVADVLISTGAICYHRGELTQATTVWREALGIARELGDRVQQGILLNNIGATLTRLDQLDEANDTLRDATELLDALGDRRSLADALRNQAEVRLRLGDYDRALTLATEALEAARDVGARGIAGMALRTLGEVCSRTLYDERGGSTSQIGEAEVHFRAALEDLRAVGLEAELAHTILAYGSFLAEVGRVDAARARLLEARDAFNRLDMSDGAERASRILAAL
ncbi:MAG: tetratricopeptide repeat protein [Myxococcales bacterium]|nr:tetratricopeptide repeat protein [Myxococcales bacterium]